MNDLSEKVRILAYELWELAGWPDGRSDEFWFAAEAQLWEPEEAATEEVVTDVTAIQNEPEEPPAAAVHYEKAA